MQTTKFRCCIKSKNKMYKVTSLVDMNDEEGVRISPDKPIVEGEQINYLTSDGDVELMQSIWLKDKNEKEGYIGDIVKFYYDLYKDSLKIGMEEKIGVIERNKYFHSCIISEGKEYHIDRLFSGEIIGNIYENPGLLSNQI